MTKRILAALCALALTAAAAVAQVNTANMPPQSVVGRLAISPGPAQAIPFATLQANLPPAPSSSFPLGACNIRPPGETSYIVVTADKNTCIVVTNITAVETITLPDPTLNFPFALSIAVLPGSTATLALPANVTSAGAGQISNDVQVQVAPYSTSTFRSDGTNWQQETSVSAPLEGGGGFNMVSAASYSTATLPVSVTVDGTCTLNDVVGFDYASSLFATQHFRHTMTTGATCIRDAVLDLTAQFRANAVVRSAIGADLVILSNPAQTSGTAWAFFFNQSWLFVVNNPPTTTGFCSPCSTETVTVAGNGATALETSSAFLMGHSTLTLGRAPAAGDLIGTIYWCGDNTTTPCFPRYGTPFYAQMGATILNPSPAVQTGRLDVFANTVAFNNEAQSGVAYGGVGVGTQTPKSLLHLNQNVSGTITGTTGTSLLLTAADAGASNVEIKANGAPSFFGTTYNGTGASPTAVTTANFLAQFAGQGYNGTSYQPGGSIYIRPAGTWSGTDQRTFMAFNTTPNTTIAQAEAGQFFPSGCLGIGQTTVDCGIGAIRAANQISSGLNGTGTGSLSIVGGTSGNVTQTVQTAAGTPTVTWGTSSGTPAVTASSPLSITAATGNITITSPLPTTNGGTATDVGTAWGAYTPTLTCAAGTLTSASATGRFKQVGKIVFVQVDISITTNGTCATTVNATLPVTAANARYIIVGRGVLVSGKQISGNIAAGGATLMSIVNYDNTFPGANGEELALSGVYESN